MAAVRLSRLVVPGMREAGGGRIVNITNIGAKQPGANSLPTSVSRAAGIALTKAMSKELVKDNILVNTVCIGLIKSAQIARAATRRFPDLPLDDAYERMGAGIPLGRVGEAGEVAALIAFLLSERAGRPRSARPRSTSPTSPASCFSPPTWSAPRTARRALGRSSSSPGTVSASASTSG